MNIAFRGEVHAPIISKSPSFQQHHPAFTTGIDHIQDDVATKMTTTGHVIISYDDKETPNDKTDDVYGGMYLKENNEMPDNAYRAINVLKSTPESIIDFVKTLGRDAVTAYPYGPQVAFSGSTEQANPFKF